MKVKHYKEIAKLTGGNAVATAIDLRKWTGEPLGGGVSAPIMVQAYIASDLKTRIALPGLHKPIDWYCERSSQDDIDFGYLETDEVAISYSEERGWE